MQCSGCGENTITLDEMAGEYHCARCGLIVEESFDYSMQWKEGSPTSEPTSFTMVNKGLGTPAPNLPIFK